MFRLTQSNVLKTTRLTNQVVSSARNSLNHSIRFNSVAIERVSSNEINNNSTNSAGLSFTNSIKNVADLNNSYKNKDNRNNNRNNNNRNNNRRRNDQNNGPYINRSSPWFNQLNAFQEYLIQAVDLTESSNQLFFWETIRKAMDLYEELKGVPDFNNSLVALLVHALHTGLRANRSQLTRLKKKPDYDSRSFHNEMQIFIKDSLNKIIDDLLSNTININENGAMHLLTSLKELKLDNDAIKLWSAAMGNDKLKNTFLKQKVVGVLLPLIYQSGTEFEKIEKLYTESKNLQNYTHPFLITGMIKTCLAADEYQKALDYFNELCSLDTSIAISSLTDVHLAFIGESKNITIASRFFEKAINREMPYRLTLQVNNVKQFLENIWLVERDFEKIVDVWVKATNFYGRNIHHGISSSLNNTFFEIFFENYASKKDEGLSKLKEIIATYNDIKPIDEPFFNIIISKCGVWNDKPTIDSLYQAYSLYNLPKSQVSRRIYLKALGSVDVSEEEIYSSWVDLLDFNDSEGYTYIANADWAALRDATVASSAKGSRDLLYCKLLKKYQYFCRDANQYKRLYTIGNIFPHLNTHLNNLDALDDSSIPVPEFKHLVRKQFSRYE